LLLALARCSGIPATPSITPAPTVTVGGLERLSIPLTPGVKVQFTATLTPGSGSQQDCTASATWSSWGAAIRRPGARFDLIPDEQLAARVMYSRPPGIVEPDHDPALTSLARSGSADAAVVYCDAVLRR
jgi:hypothetical protein